MPFALLLPAIVLVTVVVLLPTAQAIAVAFTEEDGAFGLGSVQGMFRDLAFTDAARDAIVLLILLTPLQIALATGIALVLGSRIRMPGGLLYLAALPLAVSDLAAGLLWLALFTDRGFVNSALQDAGAIAQPVSWLAPGNVAGAVLAVVLAETWRTTSIFVIAMLSGVRRTSPDTAVTLRALRPSFVSAVAIRALLVLQTFALVFALAGRNLPVLAGQAYERFAANRNEHVAAAYVVLILVLGAIASAVYVRSVGQRVASIAR